MEKCGKEWNTLAQTKQEVTLEKFALGREIQLDSSFPNID
jgi:hypothetical protein